ncbi:hypothetical protein EGW08_004825, partial [Elysia chlorotica]
ALHRIYEESPTCAGNKSVQQRFIDNEEVCISRFEIPNLDETDSANCGPFKNLRNCDRNFVRSLCGDLYGWFSDRLWLAIAKVYFPICVSDLESDQQPFPPSPAS